MLAFVVTAKKEYNFLRGLVEQITNFSEILFTNVNKPSAIFIFADRTIEGKR